MSCCSSSGSCGCPVQPCPTRYALWLPRIGFGLVLAGLGVNHYKDIGGFVQFSSSVYPTMPMVGSVAGILAYIVPALMIVGGVLFAIKQLNCVAKTCILASLSGILGWAGLAIMLGDSSSSGVLMPFIQNAAVLFILYYIIKKMTCGSSCGSAAACASGKGGACMCASK